MNVNEQKINAILSTIQEDASQQLLITIKNLLHSMTIDIELATDALTKDLDLDRVTHHLKDVEIALAGLKKTIQKYQVWKR